MAFLLLPVVAQATTVTMQEGVSGYSGTRDATIMSFSTNESISDTTQIRAADFMVYVLYFDVSSIADTATVNSAEVALQVSEQNCTDETIGVRQIEDPDASGAFDFNGSAADTFNDYATWAYKDHGSTIEWDSGATDFDDVMGNTNEDTQSSGACPGFVEVVFDVTNMVQDWVTNPSTNAGMAFSLADTGRVDVKNFRDGTAGNRPELTIDYTAGGGGGGSRRVLVVQ